MSRYKKNDAGGFGNPPLKGQFQKGCKPGPGRPKGSSTMEGALRKVFRGKVPYLENGKRKEGPATVALAKRALQHGLSGSARANEAARELAAKYGPEEQSESPGPYDLSVLSDEELEMYGRIACKLLGKPLPERTADPLTAPHTWSECTVEGIVWEHTSAGSKTSTTLISVGNRAYVSASLPRKPASPDRSRITLQSGADNEDR